MSAGSNPAPAEPQPTASLDFLAPKMRRRVEAALLECNGIGLDAVVFETYRTDGLQGLYYERGRSIQPPYFTVTNAKSNLYSWHGYQLAVDVISASEGWFNPDGKPELELPEQADPSFEAIAQARVQYAARGRKWFADVAAVFKRHGLDWGGDWHRKDLPHFQFAGLKASPSDRARELMASGGFEAVWREVGAADDDDPGIADLLNEVAALEPRITDRPFIERPVHPDTKKVKTMLYPIPDQATLLVASDQTEIREALFARVEWLYRSIASLSGASLGELWRFARDLVQAIQHWSDDLGGIPGEERMSIAIDVAWEFIAQRGGYASLRDLATAQLDRILPGFIARAAVRWIMSEQLAKALIRFVLELAVREMKDRFGHHSNETV